jgi:hypothetical protein
MSKNEIPKIAKKALSDVLSESGSILYSSHETLKSGDVYLLGFNPGGAGGKPVEQSINSMLTNTDNSYLDESWENHNGVWANGKAPLQKRVQWILESLRLNTRDVCASNLIFLQSREASDISYSLAEQCWPVHEAILNIIKPKLIIAFGNSAISPYGYLQSMLGGKAEYFPSGHGSWSVKGFSCKINGLPLYVAGLPHLSRYSPIGKNQVVEWLSKKI